MRLYFFKNVLSDILHPLDWSVLFSSFLKIFKWYPHISLALCGFSPPFLGLLFSGACAFPLDWSITSDFLLLLLFSSTLHILYQLHSELKNILPTSWEKWSEQMRTSRLQPLHCPPSSPSLKLKWWTTPDVIQCQAFSSCLFKNHFSRGCLGGSVD